MLRQFTRVIHRIPIPVVLKERLMHFQNAGNIEVRLPTCLKQAYNATVYPQTRLITGCDFPFLSTLPIRAFVFTFPRILILIFSTGFVHF